MQKFHLLNAVERALGNDRQREGFAVDKRDECLHLKGHWTMWPCRETYECINLIRVMLKLKKRQGTVNKDEEDKGNKQPQVRGQRR